MAISDQVVAKICCPEIPEIKMPSNAIAAVNTKYHFNTLRHGRTIHAIANNRCVGINHNKLKFGNTAECTLKQEIYVMTR